MVKKFLRYGAIGVTSVVTATLGFGGVASAASVNLTGPGSTNIVSGSYGNSGSIHLTGPGSTNIIRGGYGGGGSIHTTGPGSTNVVSSGHGYGKYKHVSYVKHDYSCEPGNAHKWSDKAKWHSDCCDMYNQGSWYSWSSHKNTCIDHSSHQAKDCSGYQVRSYNWVDNGYHKVSYHKDYDWKKDDHKKHEHKDKWNVKYEHKYDDKKDNRDYNKHDDKEDYKDHSNGYDRNPSYGGSSHTYKSENNNDVSVRNNTSQTAVTGNAKVYGNTNGGDAQSGDAENEADTSTDVNINNSSDDSGMNWSSNNGSGHSWGSNSYRVDNDNDVNVSNNTSQYARSGNATVSHNTNGGNATSGNASNYSSTHTSLSIDN